MNEVKNNKSFKILMILGVTFILIGVAATLSSSIFMTPKNIIKSEVKTVFTGLTRTFKNIQENGFSYDLEKEAVGIEGLLSIKADSDSSSIDLSKLNNYTLSYKGVLDKQGNKASANIVLNDSNNKVLDINSYFEGKTALINLGDIYDKNITTELNSEIKDLELTNRVELDNYITLLEKTEKITETYIKEEDIKEEKVEKQTKISYSIKVDDYLVHLYTHYLEDDEILTILSKLTDLSKEKVIEKLQKEIENRKKSQSSDTIDSYVYKEGTSIKKMEIILGSTNYLGEKEQTIITINVENDIYHYTITSKEQDLGHGEYNKKTDTITYIIESDYDSISVTYTQEKNGMKITYESKNKTRNDSTSISFKSNTVSAMNQKKNNMELELRVKESNESIHAIIKNELKIEKNKKVEKIENNAQTISINNIPYAEQEAISKKLEEKLDAISQIYTSNDNYYFRKVMDNIL